jgi:hypothetical protein
VQLYALSKVRRLWEVGGNGERGIALIYSLANRPEEPEMDIVATFVGSLAEQLHLTPKRTDRESPVLCYEFKADYEKFKMKTA